MKSYLFQILAVGDGHGGLEHRASTTLLCARQGLPTAERAAVDADYRDFLGLASHEYFHTWNLMHMRPVERVGNRVVTRTLRRHGVFLAVALREVHLPLLARHHLDDAVRDVLLRIGRHALGAALVAQDDRSVLLDGMLLRDCRLSVRVDVLGFHLFRAALVLPQSIAKSLELGLAVEHQELERCIQLGQDVSPLIGQRVLLRGRQVPALALLLRDVVDRDQDGEHDHHARGRQSALTRLPSREHARDLAPLADRVNDHAGQSRPRQVIRIAVLIG